MPAIYYAREALIAAHARDWPECLHLLHCALMVSRLSNGAAHIADTMRDIRTHLLPR